MIMKNENSWFGAKCLFVHNNLSKEEDIIIYEERVIVVRANDSDWAIKKVEKKAKEYAQNENECEYLNFIDCFIIENDKISDFTEVYSIMRKSNLEADEFISQYYDDGEQCTTEHTESDYGVDADVTAFGPFSPDIAKYLEQDEEYYKNTETGKNVIVNSIFDSTGKKESLKLAECLGIDLLDFNQHELDFDLVNIFMLKKEFGEEDTKRYIKLRDSGFKFFFMPYIYKPDLLENQ